MNKFMKKALVTIAASILLPLSASATTLDFVSYANDNEYAAEDGTRILFGDLWVEFSATSTSGNGYAYFDNGDAGLGVCSNAINVGVTGANGTENQCQVSSDDNLTFGETVTLKFWDSELAGNALAVTLDSITFRAANHDLITDTKATFTFNGDVQNMVGYSNTAALSSFTFGYDGDVDDSNQYYLNALEATAVSAVPEPATLLMLLTGMAGIVVARKRANAA